MGARRRGNPGLWHRRLRCSRGGDSPGLDGFSRATGAAGRQTVHRMGKRRSAGYDDRARCPRIRRTGSPMTDQQDSSKPLDSETVAAYLRLHPEFFLDHEELIPELRIPHQPGNAVSLVERQVKLLRERNIEMRHRLGQLMDVARDNDRLFDKTRRLVLDLLDAGSLEEVVSVVEDSLRHEFQVPFVGLILFS